MTTTEGTTVFVTMHRQDNYCHVFPEKKTIYEIKISHQFMHVDVIVGSLVYIWHILYEELVTEAIRHA